MTELHDCLRLTEQQLEAPFKGLLSRSVLKELIGTDCTRDIVHTARAGVSGGKWAHPDLVAVVIERHLSMAGPQLSLVGFELKTQKGFKADSFYQAFAYSRFLHRSYVVVCHEANDEWHWKLPEYQELATSLGVGLIRFNCEKIDKDWKVEVRARSFAPQPRKVDQFIHERMSSSVEWIKREMAP
ncbi:MAG: hypothetical protein ABL907_23715 [Hyphomicrobium sp.]